MYLKQNMKERKKPNKMKAIEICLVLIKECVHELFRSIQGVFIVQNSQIY